VLAHGFSDAGLCWTPMAQELERDYELIMVDARGHGHSEAPESGYTVPDLARDLRGVIAALGLRRPAVMGHSMGGGTTLALAGMFPEVPGAIILEDAAALDAPDFPRWQGDTSPAQSMLARLRGKTRAELLAEQHASMGWPDSELEPWADAKLQFNPRAAQFHPTEGLSWQALLPRITCPALLITADLDRGAIVDQQHIDRMRQQMPQLQVAHIPGAGHSVRREQPERFLAAIRPFLAAWAASYEGARERQ
jgi:pimeloyl-ACP methyl ester carboxylesterase